MSTQTKIVLGVALLLLPAFGYAAERTITAASLDNAYAAQVADLTVKISAMEKDLKKQPTYQGEYMSQKASDEAAALTKAKSDKEELEVVYNLLRASMQ